MQSVRTALDNKATEQLKLPVPVLLVMKTNGGPLNSYWLLSLEICYRDQDAGRTAIVCHNQDKRAVQKLVVEITSCLVVTM
jgi:hypothetical protein